MDQLDQNGLAQLKIITGSIDHQLKSRIQRQNCLWRAFQIGQHRSTHAIGQHRVDQRAASIRA